jgi:hypothetical protein
MIAGAPGAPGGRPGAGGAYQHVAEVVSVLRAPISRSELMHIDFQRVVEVSRIGSLEIGGGEGPSGGGG